MDALTRMSRLSKRSYVPFPLAFGSFVIFLALQSAVAFGRIGESPSGCRYTYGASLSVYVHTNGVETYRYVWQGFSIDCLFIDARCRSVVYKKPALDPAGINRILGLNSGDYDWHADEDSIDAVSLTGLPRFWFRSDGYVEAELCASELVLRDRRWAAMSGSFSAQEPASVSASDDAIQAPVAGRVGSSRSAEGDAAISTESPVPTVDWPRKLPAPGATRLEVLEMAGNPTGKMSFGDSDVFLYPWGSVWFSNSIVSRIESPR